jgi:hypothetical protein
MQKHTCKGPIIDPEKPFFISIAAPRGSGKTVFINKGLKQKWIKEYDHIYIITPSGKLNHDYDEAKKHEHVKLVTDTDKNVINALFNRMYEVKEDVIERENNIELGYDLPPLKCPKSLLILDDCIDSKLFSFHGVVDKIAERGRHVWLSCIVSSQRLSAISRSIRINSDLFIIFCPYQAQEFEQYIEQFVFKHQRLSLYSQIEEIFNVDYQFLFIDNSIRRMGEKLKASNADDFFNDKCRILHLESNWRGIDNPRKKTVTRGCKYPNEKTKKYI